MLTIGIASLFFVPSAFAKDCTNLLSDETCCAGVATSIIKCNSNGTETELEKTGLWEILLLVFNILTAGIYIVGVGGVVYGSIMYTSAGGNPEQVKQARTIIFNTVLGLIFYTLMFALLNYLIPGGLFSP